MSCLKIAQLASFRGNVGDQANVAGTRALLAQAIAQPIRYTDIEYLEYEPDPRWGGRKFDDEFVNLANQHDLLILGGGGFFELALDASATGTPIDISIERLMRLNVPLVVHGMGFDISTGVTPARVARFREFIEFLLNRPQTLVSFRNDGSMESFRGTIGADLAARIEVIPDGGFFVPIRACDHPELPAGRRCVAINIAGDNLGFRFNDNRGSQTNQNRFFKGLANVLQGLFDFDSTIHGVLIPHIPEDLPVIWRLLEAVGPPDMRSRITVAPYLLGETGQNYIFDIYRQCELAIGMRFHANVCPIGLGVPTIGLITHPQIAALYRELNLSDRALRVADENFPDALGALIRSTLSRRHEIRDQYDIIRDSLLTRIRAFHRRVAQVVSRSKRMVHA